MLKDDPNEGLLPSEKKQVNRSSYTNMEEPAQSKVVAEEEEKAPVKVPKKKKERSQVTYILKTLNLIVGISYLAFAIFCYSTDGLEENLQNRGFMLRWMMPAYIGTSGLVIILIQCRIGIMVRNMRFFYNYFGRGLFNVYAGGMPLMFINDWSGNMKVVDIVSIVAAAVMCLVGLIYMGLKCCCCEKEGEKIDEYNKSEDSD